jgi:flagellar protein FlbD
MDFTDFFKKPSNWGSNHFPHSTADKKRGASQEEAAVMIELTRLNGSPMLLNSDLIKTAEASPDTMLTLINGEKLIVREALREVLDRVLAYRAILLATTARKLSATDAVRRAASLTSVQFPVELSGTDEYTDVCIEQKGKDND